MSCWRISILQQSEAILSISAAFVKTTMTSHSPRAMVATGPLGEISQSFRGENSYPPQLGLFTFVRDEAPAGGMPGLLRFATRVRGDIANPTYGIKPFIIKQQERSAMRPIGLTLFPTGGMWQALSRGDREEARPITGALAMALIRNLRPLFEAGAMLGSSG